MYEILFSIPAYTLAHGEYEVDFNVSIPYVKKINSDNINLSFKIKRNSSVGNKFFIDNNPYFSSIVRADWFKSINTLSE